MPVTTSRIVREPGQVGAIYTFKTLPPGFASAGFAIGDSLKLEKEEEIRQTSLLTFVVTSGEHTCSTVTMEGFEVARYLQKQKNAKDQTPLCD